MKKINMIRRFFGVAILALAVGRTLAGETLPVLNAGGQTYTNVVVQNVSATHLFFQYAGGVGSVKLSDLNPTLQKYFGYETGKETEPGSVVPVAPVAAVGAGAGGTENAPPTGKRNVAFGMVLKEFRLSEGRVLQLCFPGNWNCSKSDSPPQTPPTSLIRLEHPYEEGFVALITVLPKNNPFERMSTDQALSIPGQHALRDAVEPTLDVEAIEGIGAKGHYFTLTRKSPGRKPACETQGLVKFGEQMVYFSVVSQDAKGKDAQAVLEMIRTAQLFTKP